MKQLKTMGYSALILLVLCLAPINGFLETQRNSVQRNTDIRKIENDRNFFGNTWQRSYGTSLERRDIRNNNGLFRDNSRQLDNDRGSFRQLDNRESRFANSFVGREVGDRKSTTRNERQRSDKQTRQLGSNNIDNRIQTRESRDFRQLHRSILTQKRDIDRSRQQITRDSRQLGRRLSAERREVRSLSSDRIREVRDQQLTRDSQNRRETRSLLSDRIRDVSHRQTCDIRTNDLQSRQLSKREIRSTSTDKLRLADSSRRQHEDERSHQVDRRQDRESRQLERREIKSASADRSRLVDNSRRQHEDERMSRQVDRRRETRQRSQVQNNPESRQMQRREIRSASTDRSRLIDSRREATQLPEIRYNRESRQLERREIRSALTERSGLVANNHRLQKDERLSRQVDDRTTRQLSDVQNNRESRQHREARQLSDIRNNRESHQLERREIRPVSTERSRLVADSRRQHKRMSRQVEDRRREASVQNNRESRQLKREEQRQQHDRRQTRNLNSEQNREFRNRREISSTLSDRIRVDNARRQLSDAREDNKLSRQLGSDRRKEFRQVTTHASLERRDFRSSDNSRRQVFVTRNEQARQLDNNQRRDVRLASFDRNTELREHQVSNARDDRQSRQMSTERRDAIPSDNSRRQFSRQLGTDRMRERRSLTNVDFRQSRQINQNRDRLTPVERNIRILDRHLTREADSRASDATRRILTLSSNDENNNQRDTVRSERQSTSTERRMATSFNTVSYIPQIKTDAVINAAQVVLLSLLVAQVVANTSKAKKNWFLDLTNFVTVTKEKVL